MTNYKLFLLLELVPILVLVPSLSYAIGSYVPYSSNFTSYDGNPTNATSMMVWTAKYCIYDNNKQQVAKDGDPTHTG